MCVCPALLAPPVVLAVSKPARHAVAHVLHRAASRLDGRRPHPATQFAGGMPCTPTFAGTGDGGLVPTGGSLLGGLAPLDNPLVASTSTGGGIFPVGGGFGGGGGGHNGGGGSGGGGSGGGGTVTPTTPPGGITPVTPVAAVPEARTWTMLITGFGAVGGAMRYRRVAVA